MVNLPLCATYREKKRRDSSSPCCQHQRAPMTQPQLIVCSCLRLTFPNERQKDGYLYWQAISWSDSFCKTIAITCPVSSPFQGYLFSCWFKLSSLAFSEFCHPWNSQFLLNNTKYLEWSCWLTQIRYTLNFSKFMHCLLLQFKGYS